MQAVLLPYLLHCAVTATVTVVVFSCRSACLFVVKCMARSHVLQQLCCKAYSAYTVSWQLVPCLTMRDSSCGIGPVSVSLLQHLLCSRHPKTPWDMSLYHNLCLPLPQLGCYRPCPHPCSTLCSTADTHMTASRTLASWLHGSIHMHIAFTAGWNTSRHPKEPHTPCGKTWVRLAKRQ